MVAFLLASVEASNAISVRHLSTPFSLSLFVAPGIAEAQGGSNDTPHPLGSDLSVRVNQLQGLPPNAPVSPGNPTGRAADRPAVQRQANATRGNPSIVAGKTRPTDATTAPAASGPSGTPSPTN